MFLDMDECSLGSHDCSEYAECTNTFGSFECKCKSGFTGDGNTCLDINECESGKADCGDEAICTNYPGGYDCSCPAGFKSVEGNQCETRDFCAADPCPEGSKCTNSQGSKF